MQYTVLQKHALYQKTTIIKVIHHPLHLQRE